jgi:hypothetical protein
LAAVLAKVGVPLNSIWLQNLAKKGSEFFSVAKGITSNSPNRAKSPTKKSLHTRPFFQTRNPSLLPLLVPENSWYRTYCVHLSSLV